MQPYSSHASSPTETPECSIPSPVSWHSPRENSAETSTSIFSDLFLDDLTFSSLETEAEGEAPSSSPSWLGPSEATSLKLLREAESNGRSFFLSTRLCNSDQLSLINQKTASGLIIQNNHWISLQKKKKQSYFYLKFCNLGGDTDENLVWRSRRVVHGATLLYFFFFFNNWILPEPPCSLFPPILKIHEKYRFHPHVRVPAFINLPRVRERRWYHFFFSSELLVYIMGQWACNMFRPSPKFTVGGSKLNEQSPSLSTTRINK